ncbi:MAG: VOC family protein, partial [Enterobacterales bacterium]|nr:VOC family protein [Enterobacterales bacterium]
MTFLAEIETLRDLDADLDRFTTLLQGFADKLELDLSAFSADHISLRCHQNATADRWR